MHFLAFNEDVLNPSQLHCHGSWSSPGMVHQMAQKIIPCGYFRLLLADMTKNRPETRRRSLWKTLKSFEITSYCIWVRWNYKLWVVYEHIKEADYNRGHIHVTWMGDFTSTLNKFSLLRSTQPPGWRILAICKTCNSCSAARIGEHVCTQQSI